MNHAPEEAHPKAVSIPLQPSLWLHLQHAGAPARTQRPVRSNLQGASVSTLTRCRVQINHCGWITLPAWPPGLPGFLLHAGVLPQRVAPVNNHVQHVDGMF
jgi:hypothetical protein